MFSPEKSLEIEMMPFETKVRQDKVDISFFLFFFFLGIPSLSHRKMLAGGNICLHVGLSVVPWWTGPPLAWWQAGRTPCDPDEDEAGAESDWRKFYGAAAQVS